jgi:hypothetical protein
MPPPAPPPPIDPALLMPCEAMPLAPDARYWTLVTTHDAEMEVHHRCAGRQRDLARSAKEQMAIAWEWYCKAVHALGFDVAECRKR